MTRKSRSRWTTSMAVLGVVILIGLILYVVMQLVERIPWSGFT